MRKTSTEKSDTEHVDVLQTMLIIAQKGQSLNGILLMIGENFADETDEIKAASSPEYKKQSAEKQRLWENIRGALPTEEARHSISKLDALWAHEVAATEYAFFALGIVFGMRYAGASEASVCKLCRTLEIPN